MDRLPIVGPHVKVVGELLDTDMDTIRISTGGAQGEPVKHGGSCSSSAGCHTSYLKPVEHEVLEKHPVEQAIVLPVDAGRRPVFKLCSRDAIRRAR
jgi:hypothetical protein